jgi:hypothetical protein
MNNQKLTYIFNTTLVGVQIAERPGELRILWNDGRSYRHSRRFLLRSKLNAKLFENHMSLLKNFARNRFYLP